ncbi:hypothetical protein Bca4012_014469 [Brassica carinata]
MDNKEAEIHFIESDPLNNNQSVKDDKATVDLLTAETVVETFAVTSSELGKACEAKVENDGSTETCVEFIHF